MIRVRPRRSSGGDPMTQLHDAPTRVLPPGLSESEFDQVLVELGAAVGSEHVLTDSEATREFRDPFWYASWDDFEASAVVQPESVEEVQAIVRIANEHKVPIWISGVGKN